MDIGNIIQQRAEEFQRAADELAGRVMAFKQTGIFDPVQEQIQLLTTLVLGLTQLGAVVNARAAKAQVESALENLKREFDPKRKGPLI